MYLTVTDLLNGAAKLFQTCDAFTTKYVRHNSCPPIPSDGVLRGSTGTTPLFPATHASARSRMQMISSGCRTTLQSVRSFQLSSIRSGCLKAFFACREQKQGRAARAKVQQPEAQAARAQGRWRMPSGVS